LIYFKSIVAGIVAAVAVAVLWILAVFVFPILIPLIMSRVSGSGGIGIVSIGSGSILIAALGGFVSGFYWQFRRLSKRRTINQ
jgi:hypothetical protein